MRFNAFRRPPMYHLSLFEQVYLDYPPVLSGAAAKTQNCYVPANYHFQGTKVTMARHRLGTLPFSKHRGVRRALVPLGAFLAVLLALINMMTVFFTSTAFPVLDFAPIDRPIFALTAVFSSLSLCFLVPTLRQRSQNAWVLAMVVAAVIVVNQWVNEANLIVIGWGILMIGYLWWQRREFHGRRMPSSTSTAEREQMMELVKRHGRTAVDHLALLSDKSYWFNEDGSAVAYVVKARIALVIGDPIGPAGDAAVTIRNFRDFCHRQGWQPAFYQTEPVYAELYKAAGFEVACIGWEALSDLQVCSPISSLNSAHHNQIEIARPPHSDVLLNALRHVDAEWQTLMAGDDGYLSFSRFEEAILEQRVLVISRDEHNDIAAFVQLILYDNGRKAAVDLLRRRHDVEGQTVNTLFDALLGWCQQQGVETVSWGMSLLTEKDETAVGVHLSRFYEKQGVQDFQEQFALLWQPRYVVFPGYVSLPAVSFALTLASNRGRWHAYLGERPLLLQQMTRLVGEQYKLEQPPLPVPLEIGVSEATSQSS